MKTKEELNALKEEVETVNKKLNELSEDELSQVTGGGLMGSLFNKVGEIGKQALNSAGTVNSDNMKNTLLDLLKNG